MTGSRWLLPFYPFIYTSSVYVHHRIYTFQSLCKVDRPQLGLRKSIPSVYFFIRSADLQNFWSVEYTLLCRWIFIYLFIILPLSRRCSLRVPFCSVITYDWIDVIELLTYWPRVQPASRFSRHKWVAGLTTGSDIGWLKRIAGHITYLTYRKTYI